MYILFLRKGTNDIFHNRHLKIREEPQLTEVRNVEDEVINDSVMLKGTNTKSLRQFFYDLAT